MNNNIMAHWLLVFSLFMCIYAENSDKEGCNPKCSGPEYICLNSECYCADGYLPNRFQTSCVKCPGLGEKCFGPCCYPNGNVSLHCWYGVCQPCTDVYGNWICRTKEWSTLGTTLLLYAGSLLAQTIILIKSSQRCVIPGGKYTMTFPERIATLGSNGDSLDQILLMTTTQAIMGTALILGIIATFVLLFKLCATADIRPMGGAAYNNGRLSIGSLQLYLDERLRNAPPRYSRTPPTDPPMYPAITYINDGFVHDCSVPPPPYTEEIKEENQPTSNRGNLALHI